MTHSVSTSDDVYLAKASNLTVVVRVQDDDTAGVKLNNPDSVLALREGDNNGATFTVALLLSEPLHDVTLKLTTSLASLVTVNPASIVVTKNDWQNIGRTVTVKALKVSMMVQRQ